MTQDEFDKMPKEVQDKITEMLKKYPDATLEDVTHTQLPAGMDEDAVRRVMDQMAGGNTREQMAIMPDLSEVQGKKEYDAERDGCEGDPQGFFHHLVQYHPEEFGQVLKKGLIQSIVIGNVISAAVLGLAWLVVSQF